MLFFGPGPMRDVYLDFRLPWPAKIAARMLTPGKWRPFEIYLTATWTAPYFDHTYLGFPSIKSNGFFTKTKTNEFFTKPDISPIIDFFEFFNIFRKSKNPKTGFCNFQHFY
jgi:hypothetical protein